MWKLARMCIHGTRWCVWRCARMCGMYSSMLLWVGCVGMTVHMHHCSPNVVWEETMIHLYLVQSAPSGTGRAGYGRKGWYCWVWPRHGCQFCLWTRRQICMCGYFCVYSLGSVELRKIAKFWNGSSFFIALWGEDQDGIIITGLVGHLAGWNLTPTPPLKSENFMTSKHRHVGCLSRGNSLQCWRIVLRN